MATKIIKRLLAPGIYKSPDGTVQSSEARIKHWEANFKKMSASGRKIPVKWDHGDKMEDFVPLKENEFRTAKDTVGHVSAFKATKNGAIVSLSITDKKAAASLGEESTFVSPVILDRFEADGEYYSDIWGHVDVVDHPVDGKQETLSVDGVMAFSAIRKSKSKKFYRLAADNKDDDVEVTDDDKDGKPEIKAEVDGESSEGDSEAVEEKTEDEELVEEGGSEGDKELDNVIALLALHDVVIEGDTTRDDFFTKLASALATSAKKDGLEIEEESVEDVSTPEDEITVASPGYMAMSAVKKQYQANLAIRLSNLKTTGRCTPVEFKEWSGKAGGIKKLSLTKTGDVNKTDVEHWIAAREGVPANSVINVGKSQINRLSNVNGAVDHPIPEGSGPTLEQQLKNAELILNPALRQRS